MYKIYSAMVKSIRQLALKSLDEDTLVVTPGFGKFYLLKQVEEGSRSIVYQPPSSLQKACKTVIKDQNTVLYGEKP